MKEKGHYEVKKILPTSVALPGIGSKDSDTPTCGD